MCLLWFAELIQLLDLIYINLPFSWLWLIFLANLMSKTTGPKSSRANVGKTGGAVGVQVAEGQTQICWICCHPTSCLAVVWELLPLSCVLEKHLRQFSAKLNGGCALGKLFTRTWVAKIKMSGTFWLGLLLELGNLNSASGQLQVSAVPEVLLYVEPAKCLWLNSAI